MLEGETVAGRIGALALANKGTVLAVCVVSLPDHAKGRRVVRYKRTQLRAVSVGS